MQRLFCVHRTLHFAALIALVLSTLAPQPSYAQSRPVEMVVSAGIDGLVEVDEPVDVAVEVAAQVLFVGTIDIVAGNSRFITPIEVPAGSTKTYDFTLPPSEAGRAGTTVRLFERDADQPVATERIRLRTPDTERVVVGIIGSQTPPELDRTLTAVGDVQIDVVEVDAEGDALGVLDYVVLGAGGDAASTELPTSLSEWVENGGRLVSSSAPVGMIGLEPVGTLPGTDAEWFRAGSGEVVVDRSIDASEWAAIIRPAVRRYAVGDQDVDFNLMQAAGAGDADRIPSIPWLFAAIVAYAAVAGPVAFLALGRLRRRELAWVVGPLVSIVALSIFWLFGRQQLADSFVSHASVVILEDDAARIESGIVVAAGQQGSHRVGMPQAQTLYASEVNPFGVASAQGIIQDNTATFDLPQLGFAGIRTRMPPLDNVGIEVTVDGDELLVHNRTGVDLARWGAMSGGSGRGGGGPLAHGDSSTVERPAGGQGMGFFNPAEVSGENAGFDDRTWSTWYPLGEFAIRQGLGDFVFGFSDDFTFEVDVDGVVRPVSGSTIFIVPMPSGAAESGVARGGLVATAPGALIEPLPGEEIVTGGGMIVEVRVPDSVQRPLLDVIPRFGQPPDIIEFWDWSAGSFVDGQLGEIPPAARNAMGQVMIRASIAGEFGGSMSPADLEVTWTT